MHRSMWTTLFILYLLWNRIEAYSNGAGGCIGGIAAVEGLHLDGTNGREVVQGLLADGMITVTVGGTGLNAAAAVDVPIGQDLLVSVDATGDVGYLGVLVRLQAPDGVDTTGALVPGTNTKVADVCLAPILGITHPDANEKFSATGTLRFDQEVLGVILDVTVVYINDDNAGSAFAYTGYTVNFRADTPAAPTDTTTTSSPAPGVPPAASPVTDPASSPVTDPVASPVTDPAASPVTTPDSSPVSTPVSSPTVSTPTATIQPTSATMSPNMEDTLSPSLGVGAPSTVMTPVARPPSSPGSPVVGPPGPQPTYYPTSSETDSPTTEIGTDTESPTMGDNVATPNPTNDYNNKPEPHYGKGGLFRRPDNTGGKGGLFRPGRGMRRGKGNRRGKGKGKGKSKKMHSPKHSKKKHKKEDDDYSGQDDDDYVGNVLFSNGNRQEQLMATHIRTFRYDVP